MTFTVKDVVELLAVVGALIAFVKMCWNVAEFAISAKTDIKELTKTVAKLEVNLDTGMARLETRLLSLETKEAIRAHVDHIHEVEGTH